MKTYRLDKFFYDHNRLALYAEASDMQFSADEQVQIESHLTGRKVTFNLDETERDRENEVTGWIYKPAPEDSDIKVLKLQVWND